MRVDVSQALALAPYFRRLEARARASGPPEPLRTLSLGRRAVRLISYSREFSCHAEKQLACILRDETGPCDATLTVWREKNFTALAEYVCLKLRVSNLVLKSRDRELKAYGAGFGGRPLIFVDYEAKICSAWNPETDAWYYAAENLAPEDFIRQGHMFVQTFSQMLKGPASALAHAALIGLGGKGVLICARGQRGKSTLAVRAMLDGFDYVADDYLALGLEEGGLYARPVYSIVTLSPQMWGELYAALDAKFVSNNARKDKYVFAIDRCCRFAARYPVSLGLYPHITDNAAPSVLACTRRGKGRAIAQLVHSTVMQTGDARNTAHIKKLLGFVRDLPFYQLNLCRDAAKNVRCLREFLESGRCGEQRDHPGLLRSRAAPSVPFA